MAGRLARASLAALLLTDVRRDRGGRPRPARGAEGPEHRTGGDERPDRRHRRLRSRPADRLRRRGLGRRLEVDERRAHVRAGLRRAAGPRDRRPRRRPADARRRLGRDGRGEPAQQHLARRRRLPDPRRREDVDERRPREDGADPPDPPPPARPETAWACAVGPAWSDGTERGVFRTTDGGKSWKKVLHVDEKTGCADLALDPGNPDHLLAAMWDFRRTPHIFRSGGPGSGLHVTWDGGESWTKLGEKEGRPEGAARADRARVLRRAPGGRLRGRRGGEERPPPVGERRAALRGRERLALGQPAPLLLRRHPRRPRAAEPRLLARDAAARLDGRREDVREPPRDGPPAGPRRPPRALDRPDASRGGCYLGNDGGMYESRDRGETFRFVGTLPLAQYYHVAVDGRDALQRLRRAAGQQLVARAVVGLAAGRDPGAPLEGGRRRRRLRDAPRPGGPGARVLPLAGREPDALERDDGRAPRRQAAGARPGRSSGSTGTRRSRSTRSSRRRSGSGASSSTARRTGARRGRR